MWLQVNCTCTLIPGKCFTIILSIKDLVIIKYLNKFPVSEFNLVIDMFVTLNTSSYNSIQCKLTSIGQYGALKFLTIWTWITNLKPWVYKPDTAGIVFLLIYVLNMSYSYVHIWAVISLLSNTRNQKQCLPYNIIKLSQYIWFLDSGFDTLNGWLVLTVNTYVLTCSKCSSFTIFIFLHIKGLLNDLHFICVVVLICMRAW